MATSNAAADAERRLRLLAEELIAQPSPDGLAEVEACASVLADAGVLRADAASGLLVAVVDALVLRGVPWLEPAAVDLDVARLREAVGSSRPELRAVVPVGAALDGEGSVVTLVALWDDRAEARVVAADGRPAATIVLDAVGPGEHRLEVRDGAGRTVTVELDDGVAGGDSCDARSAAAGGALARLETWTAAEARRSPHDIEHLNRLRRQLVLAGDLLAAGPGPVERFDALVASLPSPSPSSLVEVVPLARRAGDRWLLAVERWTDHWRLQLAGAGAGRERWTASVGGERFGGVALGGGEVVRFDPALPSGWSTLAVTAGPETFEVRR